jgi:hypothetical protein
MIAVSSSLAMRAFYPRLAWHAGPMRANRWAIVVGVAAVVGVGASAASCGGDDGDDADDPASPPAIEVVIADDTSPIAPIRDVRCERVDDTQLVATGIVSSNGDDTHYVNLQVRFVDGDGVRVELATDSVSDLLIGEDARWNATVYADGAPDVRRCEVTATVG